MLAVKSHGEGSALSGQMEQVEWRRHPDAEHYVQQRVEAVSGQVASLQQLAHRLLERTGSRLVDWVDHVMVADGDRTRGELAELGFEPEQVPTRAGDRVYHHPGAILPRFLLRSGAAATAGVTLGVALQVEDIAAFQMAHGLASAIEGVPLGAYRSALAWSQADAEVLAIERRGYAGFEPVAGPREAATDYLTAREQWATRRRDYRDELEGMEHTLALARSMVAEWGADRAAWAAFEVEREYWQQRNRAAQIQKERQDSLGMGWANHDHHTFRSSRRAFPLLIEILETFGFQTRERFYAGAEAGWGAQVLEQPVCRFAVFADVDLGAEEVEGDFAHRVLPPRQELGTVGLWCALHGESMLEAGLHHVAARLDFDVATAGLEQWGARVMRPFSNFSYLRQAFTVGERWQVPARRLTRLADAGQVDADQQRRFADEGAVGSHLENIQRAGGFKGFNQQKVSDIIRRTDPRALTQGSTNGPESG
jgi:hypothetical protein